MAKAAGALLALLNGLLPAARCGSHPALTPRAPPPPPLHAFVCRMFVAGGSAGAVARTATAPLDRIKLLFQVQAVPSAGVKATAYTGVGQAARKILAEEGLLAFWKGNGLNIIRWVQEIH